MSSDILTQVVVDPESRAFYCEALGILNKAKMPFLIGGAYAFERYTGIGRHTKDLDLFVHPRDVESTLKVFSEAGYETELSVSHWLGKAFCGDNFVDFIFSAANGIAMVDDIWFDHAMEDKVFDIPVLVCPPEEMIWSKGFIMARDRYDGADVAHLIYARGKEFDWTHLLARFGVNWRVLYSHLILFGFIYPGERSQIPNWVMEEFQNRLQQEINNPPTTEKICQGPVLAPLQYQIDVQQWGYKDARVSPTGNMTAAEVTEWTEHLKEEKKQGK
jgi:catechol 2,3-dioxygenase-like lactoylglutathione lyase family enzyme